MEENSTKPYAISRRGLLSVYLIIPLLLLLVLLDQFFFDQKLKVFFDVSLVTTMLYLLFFEQPHIVASFIGYADSEYLRFYRKKIFVYLPILLLATFIIIQVDLTIAFFLYVIYTMYHAIKQQTGIAGMLLRTKSRFHMTWTYALVFYAILGNVYIFAPAYLVPSFDVFSILTVLTMCVTSAYVLWLKKLSLGWWYAFATTMLIPASYVCIVFGYAFFAVLLVRFVHDITAFIFYAVHDSNRNFTEKRNFIYRLLPHSHFPILMVTPIIGVGVTFLIQSVTGITQNQSLAFLILIGFIHYYIESFMWKHDSIHRAQLRFVG